MESKINTVLTPDSKPETQDDWNSAYQTIFSEYNSMKFPRNHFTVVEEILSVDPTLEHLALASAEWYETHSGIIENPVRSLTMFSNTQDNLKLHLSLSKLLHMLLQYF